MNLGFWKQLKKPILALAPMANVTDAAFRKIIARYGKPDVFWTEFVSVEGLLKTGAIEFVEKHGSPTSLKLRRADSPLLLDLMYGESERPIVAQIFGGKPGQFFKVAKLCKELKFDGIDINMGCPDKGVEKSGGGAALIKNPKLAQEIIKATQEGAPNLPVSVKTRIGYNKNEIETWIPALLETGLAALTVHLRTRKEMSLVPAHWELMCNIVEIRNRISPETVLLGNGDVLTMAEGREKAKQYGIDGVMIGRGIFGNPWFFANHEKPSPAKRSEVGQPYLPSIEEKIRVCLEHTQLFEELYGDPGGLKAHSLQLAAKSLRLKPFDVMKKHYKAYINGFDGAKELRMKLMEAKDVNEVVNILLSSSS